MVPQVLPHAIDRYSAFPLTVRLRNSVAGYGLATFGGHRKLRLTLEETLSSRHLRQMARERWPSLPAHFSIVSLDGGAPIDRERLCHEIRRASLFEAGLATSLKPRKVGIELAIKLPELESSAPMMADDDHHRWPRWPMARVVCPDGHRRSHRANLWLSTP